MVTRDDIRRDREKRLTRYREARSNSGGRRLAAMEIARLRSEEARINREQSFLDRLAMRDQITVQQMFAIYGQRRLVAMFKEANPDLVSEIV